MIRIAAKPVLELRRKTLAEKTARLKATSGKAPHLSVILVGEDPASRIYVQKKGETAEKMGFTHETLVFPDSVSPESVRKCVEELNRNPEVDGILIQRPLPKGWDERDTVFWISPQKDVDCLHPENLGLLVSGNPRFMPCTPAGILLLLDHYGLPVDQKTVCVIGRSPIVGKPLAALLLNRNASIIQIHRSTPDPKSLSKLADFVFVAAGAPALVDKDWVKPGAVVVDVGIHRNEAGKVSGDVDAASVATVASALTPVPGGVGPMTIQVLLENTFESYARRVSMT